MAPEIIFNQPYDGRSVDLFASTVILFAMKSSKMPFYNPIPSREP